MDRWRIENMRRIVCPLTIVTVGGIKGLWFR